MLTAYAPKNVRAWEYWQAFLAIIAKEHREVLEELRKLLPAYIEAVKLTKETGWRIGDGWRVSLDRLRSHVEEAPDLAEISPALAPALEALTGLYHGLEEWARRWWIYHPQALEAGLARLELWERYPEDRSLSRGWGIGPAVVYDPLSFGPPRLPAWNPEDESEAAYLERMVWLLKDYIAEVREQAEAQGWDLERKRELEEHLRWLAERQCKGTPNQVLARRLKSRGYRGTERPDLTILKAQKELAEALGIELRPLRRR